MRFAPGISLSMSLKGGLAVGSGSALHAPRISRSVVDQLETHLSSLGAPAAQSACDRLAGQNKGSTASAIPHAPTQLRIDQLENALSCVKKAAKVMADLDEQAVSADERAEMQEALAALERRLLGHEREFATVSEQLEDARRETEEHRQRSMVAESKLDSLMAAVAKMIARLGTADAVTRRRSPPALRGSLTSDEVSA